MKSASEIVYNQLKNRAPGSKILLASLANANPSHSQKSINGALARMVRKGYLERFSRGIYIVNDKTKSYGDGRGFRTKPKNAVFPKSSKTKKSENANVDVLQALLDAMAEAEPEIRRLKSIEQELISLTRMVNKHA